MPKVELTPEIADEVPWSEKVSDYDERHFIVYVRLLDAAKAGVSKGEMACVILGIDPIKERQRARKALDSHLRRAKWMTKHGYKQLMPE